MTTLYFTQQAVQITPPSDTGELDDLWDEQDYHVVRERWAELRPWNYIGLDHSKSGTRDWLTHMLYHAPVDRDLPGLNASMDNLVWTNLVSLLCTTFNNISLQVLRDNAEDLEGRAMFLPVLAFSGGDDVVTPDAVRVLASDFRHIMVTEYGGVTEEKRLVYTLCGYSTELRDAYFALRDGVLATARAGGILSFR